MHTDGECMYVCMYVCTHICIQTLIYTKWKFKILTFTLLNYISLAYAWFLSTWVINFAPLFMQNHIRACYASKLYTSLTLFTCHQLWSRQWMWHFIFRQWQVTSYSNHVHAIDTSSHLVHKRKILTTVIPMFQDVSSFSLTVYIKHTHVSKVL